MNKLFSYRNRPVHLGSFPLEKLARADSAQKLDTLPDMNGLSFNRVDDPTSIINAMQEYQAMLDATREGLAKPEVAVIPDDPKERANHLKAFGYFCDTSMVGICEIPKSAWLDTPIHNQDVTRLAGKIETMQVKTLAAGIDVIMAGLKDAMRAHPADCRHHTHAIAFLYDMPRLPRDGETGTDWIKDCEQHRACLRSAETAVTLASYIRLLGYEARAHTMAASDIHLDKIAVQSGLATVENGEATNPFVGTDFGLAVVTTTLEISPDKPLATNQTAPFSYKTGTGTHAKTARNRDPFKARNFKDGPHPFETLKRRDDPTTYIDAPNVPRTPKRANMFARALFGDLGRATQIAATNGNYVRKSAASYAFRPSLGAFILLQDGDAALDVHPTARDPKTNADNIKAALYYLGADAVGLSDCPDYAYYSHDSAGQEIIPYHKHAISMIIDQGHETMEGASGDDWIACAQSMRAYLRFSLLGGVVAEHIRRLGYSARVHSVVDEEVLQPPLLLLAGLGELSRIGEVILNPFLGPRLKSGVVTTNMPMVHDKPIDFGLQTFCESCNKCARECPSGAITAGPKAMFNGYEIWKSDSQKCTTYRVGQKNGAMCGRCMKTCPWNLEGLFKEALFRAIAMRAPKSARWLAKLDDALGNGGINPVKKWWWDLEMENDGPFKPTQHPVNARELQTQINLKPEDQTLAVYPAPLAPPPFNWPFPMDREAAIKAHRDMISVKEYKRRRAQGLPPEHIYSTDIGDAPVIQVVVDQVIDLTNDTKKYVFAIPDGTPLPAFTAGAHIDVVVAPEFFRQYSLSGNPNETGFYEIAVQREDNGRGGSALMHRIFEEGRKVFISKPINHFELDETATCTYLMGGGIGVTPLIAMAHRLHSIGTSFELHYSVPTRDQAAFLASLSNMPWVSSVHLHISDEGTRAVFSEFIGYTHGTHIYTCGTEAYMNAVIYAAKGNGFPDENCHREYFNVPDAPEYENHDFILKLAKSGREIPVSAEQSGADALNAASVHVDVKCADGLCGVCKCGLLSGDVEHRDFVLSNKERETSIVLCQSRAAKKDGIIVLDM